MTYATRISTLRRKPAPRGRAAIIARATTRLEREHVALLLALSELEASDLAADSAMRDALSPLLRTDLRRAQYALSRIDSGLYGVCDVCARPIAARLLNLAPATTRCPTCEGHGVH